MAPSGRVALVSGASQGIGRAIAARLAADGMTVVAVARTASTLDEAVGEITAAGGHAIALPADVAEPDAPTAIVERVLAECGRLDVLVHSAASYAAGRIADAPPEDLEAQLAVNVVAPYALTRAALDALTAAAGDVVVVGSTAALRAASGVSQYAATKHALRAFTDALRDEVNDSGIRVLSIHPGRTATPMQEAVHAGEGKAYHPDALLQAEDVAAMVSAALALPRRAEVTEILMRPARKS